MRAVVAVNEDFMAFRKLCHDGLRIVDTLTLIGNRFSAAAAHSARSRAGIKKVSLRDATLTKFLQLSVAQLCLMRVSSADQLTAQYGLFVLYLAESRCAGECQQNKNCVLHFSYHLDIDRDRQLHLRERHSSSSYNSAKS